jgi:hypothetical protein
LKAAASIVNGGFASTIPLYSEILLIYSSKLSINLLISTGFILNQLIISFFAIT